MACNNNDPNCYPCGCEQPAPEPVLPRCDNVLPDGVYANATVIVVDGCISSVQAGSIPMYAPEVCCSAPGGGGSTTPPPAICDCDDGITPIVTIGDVDTLPAGASAYVTNSGASPNVILNFGIPTGEDGTGGGGGGSTTGCTDLVQGGIEVQDGLIVDCGTFWPPIMYMTTNISPADITGTVTKVQDVSSLYTGEAVLSLNFDTFISNLNNSISLQLQAMDQQIRDDFQTELDTINQRITDLEARVTACGCA